MSDKVIVNSWNEWDPLKHVIVGRADGTCIPAPEPALDAKVPEDSDMRGQFGPRTKNVELKLIDQHLWTLINLLQHQIGRLKQCLGVCHQEMFCLQLGMKF